MAAGEAALERLLQALRRRQVRVDRLEAVWAEGGVLRVVLETSEAERAARWIGRLCDVEEVTHG